MLQKNVFFFNIACNQIYDLLQELKTSIDNRILRQSSVISHFFLHPFFLKQISWLMTAENCVPFLRELGRSRKVNGLMDQRGSRIFMSRIFYDEAAFVVRVSCLGS